MALFSLIDSCYTRAHHSLSMLPSPVKPHIRDTNEDRRVLVLITQMLLRQVISICHDKGAVLFLKVLLDQIRPDWEAKLASVRAAVARRANRRIVMRQVGDRLIPIGITSGRTQPSGEDGTAGDSSETGGSSRRRRRLNGSQISGLEQYVGMAGQDLEELMIMEAMRLSLIEHETQQKKDAEEEKKKADSNPASSEAGPSAAAPVRQLSDQSTNVPQHRPTTSLSVPQQIEGHSRSSSLSRIFQRNRDSTNGRDSPTNPPPFSTLSAALSAASTAGAFVVPSESQTPVAASPAPSTPSETGGQLDAGAQSTSSAPVLPPIAIPLAIPNIVDESNGASHNSTDHAEYDVLQSSPETTARKPLLSNESYSTTSTS